MNVHLRGAFLLTRAAQKYMVEQKWAPHLNLSSISALGNRGQLNYSAAKAGMQGLTKTLGSSWVRSVSPPNAIAPRFSSRPR